MTGLRSTSEPSSLALVRTLRRDRAALTGDQIDGRLVEIEHSLQRSLSVDDVARLAGEKPDTIHKAIRRGQLPASRSAGSNTWRLEQADVDIWVSRPRRRRQPPETQSQSDLVRSH
ncbi:helix-turn-helix domain-containing protein [Brevundimonas albigilva]|uniref:Helix-turn-helix domain-containing protein n=1 Tax=Brevundimonas albigilva TaxID=1312364 RepID=A0ABY4SKI8_9CAUL|nr:helix-turn-helix domain-containing protein [Brevundimonas albigilva]UQV19650.1 helix-turn-helix domain-containing protein [Brevundimonas albigilva]URI15323.1 helix-turn-helix domain-containing protein [Brevundimonas albigilva]